MKQFKNKFNGTSIHIYEKNGRWFIKITEKHQRLKSVVPIADFKNEGDALLALAMSKDLKFNNFKQVYP